MAAEPVGSAFIILRAISEKLAGDIQDGLDRGAKNVETDDAAKDVGERMGVGTGDEFSESFTERSSEGLEDAADDPRTRRATDSFTEKLGARFSERFRGMSDDIGDSLNTSIGDNIRNAGDDDDIDAAGDRIGTRLGDRTNTSFASSFRERFRRNSRTIGDGDSVDTDSDRIGNRISQGILSAFTSSDGGSFGSKLGSSIQNSLNSIEVGKIGWLAIFAVPALGIVVQSVIGLLGQVVAMIGYIATAAAGAGIALLGVAAAIGPAFFVIKGAFGVESDMLDAFNDQLDHFKEKWESVALATQETLLPALSATLENLEILIPVFERYGATIGQVVGDIAFGASRELTSPANIRRIDSILTKGAGVVDTLGQALVTLITPMLTVIEAAMPIAQRFADSIKSAADRFAAFIENKGAAGLTETFDKWYDRLARIGRIIGNVFSGIWSIFSIGADSNEGFFGDIEAATERFSEWTKSFEGENALMTFFDNARAISGELWGILTDIAGLLFTGMGEAGGADGVIGALRSFRTEWLPQIIEFGKQLYDQLKGPISEFFGALGTLFDVLAQNPELIGGVLALIAPKIILFTAAMKIFADLLENPAFANIALIAIRMLLFAQVLSKFGLLSPIISLLGKLAGALGGALSSLLGGPLAALAANPIVLIVAAVVAAITLLYFHVQPFRDFVDTYIIDPLQRLWSAIGGFAGIIDFFRELPSTIVEGIRSLVDFIADNWTELPQMIAEGAAGLIDSFTGWIADVLPGAMRQLGRLYGSLLRLILTQSIRLGRAIISFIADLPGHIRRLMPEAGGALSEFFRGLPAFFLSTLQSLGIIILAIFRNLPSLILTALSGIGNFLLGMFETLAPELLAWAERTLPGVIDAITGFFEDLPGRIGDFLLQIPELFATLASNLPSILSSLGSTLLGVGEKLIGFIWDGIQFGAGLLLDYFTQLIPNVLIWIGTTYVGLLTRGAEILGKIWEGMWGGILAVANFFQNLIPDIIGWIGTAFSTLLSVGQDIIGRIAEGIVAGAAIMQSWFANLMGLIGGWIVSAGTAGLNFVGGLIIDAILAGIEAVTDVGGAIADWFADLPNKIVEWVGDLAGAGLGIATKLALAIIDGLRDALSGPGSGIIENVLHLNEIEDALDPLRRTIRENADGWLEEITRSVNAGETNITGAFSNVMSGVLEQLGGEGSAIGQRLMSALGVALNDGALSTAEWEQLMNLAAALAVGDDTGELMAESTAQGLGRGLAGQDVTVFANEFMRKFGDGLQKGVATNVTPHVEGIPRQISNSFNTTGKTALEGSGTTLISGLRSGIDSSLVALRVQMIGLALQFGVWLGGMPDALAGIGSAMMLTFGLAVLVGVAGIGEILSTLPAVAQAAIAPMGARMMRVFTTTRTLLSVAALLIVVSVEKIFSTMPARSAAAIANLGALMAARMIAAGNLMVRTAAQIVVAVATMFIQLGPLSAQALSNLGPNIAGGILGAWGSISAAIRQLISMAASQMRGLPSALASAMSGVGGQLSGALRVAFRSAWNNMVSSLPPINFAGFGSGLLRIPGFSIPTGFLRLANGGIFGGKAGGYLANIAEAGSEAVIPLSRPRRAMELMWKSGLAQMMMSTPRSQGGIGGSGTVEVMHIDHAVFHDSVSVDMVAAKIATAYDRAAS